MSRKILVTGGAGYLGSVLCPALLGAGYSVRCFDRLYFGDKSLKAVIRHPKFEFIQGNMTELDRFPDLLKDVDGVIHLAELSNDPSCDVAPELAESVNYQGTLQLARRAQREGVRRFVFSSSCSVYGDAKEDWVSEESPLRPVSLYARIKGRTEEDLLALNGDSMSVTILRMATLFGHSPRMRFDLAVNLMTLHAVKHKRITVVGGGNQWRPFLHVSDAAGAFQRCLEAPLEAIEGQIFNAGHPEGNFRIVDLARLVAEFHPDAVVDVAPTSDEEKRSYRVKFEKILKRLAWKPRVDVPLGIKEISSVLREERLPNPDDEVHYNLRVLKRLKETPAVEGGERVRESFLPFSLPLTGPEEEQEVLDTLRSGWLTSGPKTARFEAAIRELTGASYALAVNSCTSALHLALLALGVGKGDEVITTPVTWPATANVIVHTGAKPVFVDVNPETLNIDPKEIESRITPHTKAILPVHIAGQPCELDAIHQIAQRHGIPVIEDAAHAMGAEYRGRKIGQISDITCFSFYANKNVTTGEGGAVVTDNKKHYEFMKLYSLQGVTKDAWQRYGGEETNHWDSVAAGFKYNLSDLHAAIGIHQLKKLSSFLAARQRYAEMFDQAFADVEEIETPKTHPDVFTTWHLYIIKLRLEQLRITRDAFMKALQAERIGTGLHYRSLHLQPYYRETFKLRPNDYPHASQISERIVSLPIYPKMSFDDVQSVIRAVKKVIRHFRKDTVAESNPVASFKSTPHPLPHS